MKEWYRWLVRLVVQRHTKNDVMHPVWVVSYTAYILKTKYTWRDTERQRISKSEWGRIGGVCSETG